MNKNIDSYNEEKQVKVFRNSEEIYYAYDCKIAVDVIYSDKKTYPNYELNIIQYSTSYHPFLFRSIDEKTGFINKCIGDTDLSEKIVNSLINFDFIDESELEDKISKLNKNQKDTLNSLKLLMSEYPKNIVINKNIIGKAIDITQKDLSKILNISAITVAKCVKTLHEIGFIWQFPRSAHFGKLFILPHILFKKNL